MTEHLPDDRPWTEDEWERFMRKSDVRSAKYGELLETFYDHPDCDEIIDREMGWDRDPQEDGVEFPQEDGDAFDFSEAGEAFSDEDGEAFPDEDWQEIRRREKEALRAIPAYTLGYDWGLKVHEALKPYLKEEPEPDEDLVEAFGSSIAVAAKIAGGHGMGYDDDALCGNVVCCKRALEEANKSVTALESLARRSVVPAETLRPLLEEGRRVVRLVEEHIAALRARVWWE